jgi:hypothetical protein
MIDEQMLDDDRYVRSFAWFYQMFQSKLAWTYSMVLWLESM